LETKLRTAAKFQVNKKTSQSEPIFFTKDTRNSGNETQKYKRIRCFNCNEEGHKSSECPKPRNDNNISRNYRGGHRGRGRGVHRGRGRGRYPQRNYNWQKSGKEEINITEKQEDRDFVFGIEEEEEIINTSKTTMIKDDIWIIDSGASTHICKDKDKFTKLKDTNKIVAVANGKKIPASGIGDVKINVRTKSGRTGNIIIRDALYIPEFKRNLLSVRALLERGHKVEHSSKGGRIILRGKTEESIQIQVMQKLYIIQESIESKGSSSEKTQQEEKTITPKTDILQTPVSNLLLTCQDAWNISTRILVMDQERIS
jgi:hypothetical protein